MEERTSWDIDDLVEKEGGKIYECLFCLGKGFCNSCRTP